MIIVGRNRLDDAMKSGQIPSIAARCWVAEADDSYWSKDADVAKAYKDTEILGRSRLLIPLDEGGHCIVAVVNYEAGVVQIAFAGHRKDYLMGSGRAGQS